MSLGRSCYVLRNEYLILSLLYWTCIGDGRHLHPSWHQEPRKALFQFLLARNPIAATRTLTTRRSLEFRKNALTSTSGGLLGSKRPFSSLPGRSHHFRSRAASRRGTRINMKAAGDDNELDKAALALLAGLVGAVTGLIVGLFKLSIAFVTTATYSGDSDDFVRAAIPAIGGLAVAIIRFLSTREAIGPGLADHVAEVQNSKPFKPEASLARGVAAVATLGTGNSMGPEGPAVELGVAVSRFIAGSVLSEVSQEKLAADGLRLQRQLIAAGAASGVAAGFNAPLAGVFFSLEVVDDALRSAVATNPEENGNNAEADRAELDVKSKTAISMAAIAALVATAVVRVVLGDELALRFPETAGEVRSPFVEIPLSVGLGACAGAVALLFDEATQVSREVFRRIGSTSATTPKSTVEVLQELPARIRPVLGGLVCGIIGLAIPQILFFGYSTLDALIAMGATPSAESLGPLPDPLAGPLLMNVYDSEFNKDVDLVVLLFAKILTTAICIGSGLVGGTFAPSIFLGAVLGVAYQSVAGAILASLADAIANYQISIGVPVGSWGVIPQLTVADSPAYAMIGAAATLSSVFRAPLTASLLVFELSRKYDIILPLIAAAGTGPLVVEQFKIRGKRPDQARPEECDIDNEIICDSRNATEE